MRAARELFVAGSRQCLNTRRRADLLQRLSELLAELHNATLALRFHRRILRVRVSCARSRAAVRRPMAAPSDTET